MRKRWWLWVAMPAAICVVAFALTRWHIFIFSHMSEKTEILKYWVNKLGIWAPIVYILGYVLRPLVFFPATPFAILGGLLFGNIWGTFYVVIGTMCSGVCEFLLVRYFAREKTRQFLKKKAPMANQIAERHGFLTVFFVRLIPNVAFDLQNYGLALTPVKFRHYFYGTLLGCFPACVIYVSFGHYMIHRPAYWGDRFCGIVFSDLFYFPSFSRFQN